MFTDSLSLARLVRWIQRVKRTCPKIIACSALIQSAQPNGKYLISAYLDRASHARARRPPDWSRNRIRQRLCTMKEAFRASKT